MAAKRIPEIDQLFVQLQTFRETNNFYKIIKSVAALYNFSAYNAALIHLQKPGAIFAATATKWEKKFNRYIKPNARPLIILKPFGPIELIYEYNDTEGAPLPDEVVNPFKCEKEINPRLFEILKYGVGLEGIDVSFQEVGTSLGGKICCLSRPRTIEIDLREQKEKIISYISIVLNDHNDITTKFTTLTHELGHYFCGHIPTPQKIKYPHQGSQPVFSHFPIYRDLPPEIEEFEAETVSWLVCRRLKIENEASVRYLHSYMENNKYIPENISLEAILKAVNHIEAILNGKFPKTYIDLLINPETHKREKEIKANESIAEFYDRLRRRELKRQRKEEELKKLIQSN